MKTTSFCVFFILYYYEWDFIQNFPEDRGQDAFLKEIHRLILFIKERR